MVVSPGGEEVGVFEFHGVRFGQQFLGIEEFEEFRSSKSLSKMASWMAQVRLEIQWSVGGAGWVAMVAWWLGSMDPAWCREGNCNQQGTSRLDKIACCMEFDWCRSGDSREFLEFQKSFR